MHGLYFICVAATIIYAHALSLLIMSKRSQGDEEQLEYM